MEKEQTILNKFTDKFPILKTIYDIYSNTEILARSNPDNTIRKSAEITVLEIIEMVVVATHQDRGNKKNTLMQILRKIDTLIVFVDMVETNTRFELDGYKERIFTLKKMVTGWIKAIK